MAGSCLLSVGQWQELELQELIYRYILAGVVVPPELLQSIKKSLLYSSSSPYILHHHLPPLQHFSSTTNHYYQPSWYWGRAAMDPEPGRCRRTDGKKWRCSRDVVPGQKYCERHVHRGRNRSRKPVEIPTPATTTTTSSITTGGGRLNSIGGSSGGPGGGRLNNSTVTVAAPSLAVADNGTSFSISGPSPSNDLFHHNHGYYT